MGIIIKDDLALDIGISKTGCYISFGEHSITITKLAADSYQVSSAANVWADQAARDRGASAMQGLSINITINEAALSSNLYTSLYTELKTNYKSTTDVM